MGEGERGADGVFRDLAAGLGGGTGDFGGAEGIGRRDLRGEKRAGRFAGWGIIRGRESMRDQ